MSDEGFLLDDLNDLIDHNALIDEVFEANNVNDLTDQDLNEVRVHDAPSDDPAAVDSDVQRPPRTAGPGGKKRKLEPTREKMVQRSVPSRYSMSSNYKARADIMKAHLNDAPQISVDPQLGHPILHNITKVCMTISDHESMARAVYPKSKDHKTGIRTFLKFSRDLGFSTSTSNGVKTLTFDVEDWNEYGNRLEAKGRDGARPKIIYT